MGKLISLVNQRDSYKFSGIKFSGFTFLVDLVASGALGTSLLIDASKLVLKGTLKRGGNSIVVFSDNLRNLMVTGSLDRAALSCIFKSHIGSCNSIKLTPAGNSVRLPLMFDLQGVIDLTDGDEFILDWALSEDFFSHANITKGTSSITVEVMETLSNEYYTPIFNVHSIEANQPNPTFDIGSGVRRIVLANYTYTNDNDFVLDNVDRVDIDSDQFEMSETAFELKAKQHARLNEDDFNQKPSVRRRKYMLYDSSLPLNNAKVKLNLLVGSTIGVVAGDNYVFTISQLTSDWHVTRAALKDASIRGNIERAGKFNETLAANMVG